MNPTTDELIKEECKCDIADMRRCYRCGHLQGRLDVLELFMDNTSYCCDEDKILQGLGCRICLLRCDCTKEIFMIKEVLK